MTDDTDAETGDDDASSVEPMYVYTGPKPIADLKMRLAKWLERKGW